MIKKAFGDKVRYYRKQAGLTQEELAHTSGVGARFLQEIEAGEKQPSLTTIFKLASVLDIKPSEFIDDAFEEWLKGEQK